MADFDSGRAESDMSKLKTTTINIEPATPEPKQASEENNKDDDFDIERESSEKKSESSSVGAE